MMQGLTYLPDFISKEEETDLITEIDKSPWNTDISRRRQQYGIEYIIQGKGLNSKGTVPPIPAWLNPLIQKIKDRGFMDKVEQAIINEYTPGQGIAAHIDSPVFGDKIVSVSLGSTVPMVFERAGKSIEQVLERRSLLALSGEARYEWKHSIEKKRSDMIDDCLRPRGRRVSITLRSLKV